MNSYIVNDFRIFDSLGLNCEANYVKALSLYEEETGYQKLSPAIEKYYKRFNLPDAIVTDYLNKEIEFEGGSVIVSLRFRNLDINTPFIEVVYSSFEIGENNLQQLIKAILVNYQTRSIRFIHFFSRHTIEKGELPGYSVSCHKILYAARLSETTPVLAQTVNIHPARSGDFYDQYFDEYEKFHQENSNNKIMSQAESLEYIVSLIQEERVFKILIKGEFAGIIAYDKKRIFSVEGIEVVEEFLFSKFRGHGQAKFAQGILISEILSKHEAPSSLLYGTIHYLNIPSRVTAVYNGRKPLGKWYQVNL